MHCILCGAHVDSHAPSCPTVTELWPITADEVRIGMVCEICEASFVVGEYYIRRDSTLDLGETVIPVAELVCLSCAASEMAEAE
jgi:hypothetical protein